MVTRGMFRPLALAIALSAAGCASPLYTGSSGEVPGTVPRDEMGEPIWEEIEPAEDTGPKRRDGASDGT